MKNSPEPIEHIEFIKEKKHIVSITYDINYKKLKYDLVTYGVKENITGKIYIVKLKIIWYKFRIFIEKIIRIHNNFWLSIHFRKGDS